MNSAELQKKFPEVYRDFFSKNDLVVSGCFSMAWGNESIIHQSKYVLTRSKVPLKCYLWLKKNTNKKVEFTEIICFDSSRSNTESIPYRNIIKEETIIIDKIQKYLTGIGITEGVTISILSEIPRGHSFWFSDTLFAILSVAINVFFWKIESDTLKNYSEFEQSPYFQEVLDFSWSLSLVARYGNTIAQCIRNILSSSWAPLAVYCQEFSSHWEENVVGEKKANSLNASYQDSYLWVERELSLDYGVLFTGIETNSKQIEEMKESDFLSFRKYGDFIKNDILHEDSGFFFDSFSDPNVLIRAHEQILSFLSIKTIYFLQKIYRSGLDFQIITDFIEHVNNQRKFLSIISKENHFTEQFYSIFHKLKRNALEDIGIIPIYSSKLWGWCAFVMKPWISRDTFNNTLKEIRQFYPNAEIDYCSYIDGTSHDGVIIEQFIGKEVYSKYIQKNQVIYKNNFGDSYMSTHNDILETETDGLLIDTLFKKIYMNGIRLTSKEIPAQSTTSEVLSILLERIGEDVSTKEFPISSYVSNKNEMLGKIVLPLVKIIKETFDIDFPFVCKGNLSEFYLKLGETNLRVWVIKNI